MGYLKFREKLRFQLAKLILKGAKNSALNYGPRVIMKYKSINFVCSGLAALIAVAFVAAPDVFTFNMHPGADGLALEVGIVRCYITAATALMGAVIIFSVRDVTDVKLQRTILLGLGIGFTIPCLTFIILVWSHNVPLQLFLVFATGFAAATCYRAMFRLEARQLVVSGRGCDGCIYARGHVQTR